MACATEAQSHYMNQCRLDNLKNLKNKTPTKSTHWPPGRCGSSFESISFKLLFFLFLCFLNSLRPSDAYMHQYTYHHWFRKWLVAWSAPSHYLKQCWNIVNLTLRNKFEWNINRNSHIFIRENAFEMWSAKCWPFCLGLDVLTHNN